MIKKIGIAFFGLVAVSLVALGLVRHEPAALAVGGITLVFVVVLVLGSTVFRKSMDTPESGELGMKVIRKALGRYIRGDGD